VDIDVQDNIWSSDCLLAVLAALSPFYVSAYNGAMQIVNFPEHQFNQMGASGECPHCKATSYFRPLATCFETPKLAHTGHGQVHRQRAASACQCESCKEFVLVVGTRDSSNNAPFSLIAVYPLGKPNDTIAPEVTNKDVAEDFKEALRCHWIRSYRASVVMCRRAIQSSAIDLKAKGGRLIDQIDDLFASGKITEALKEFAHEVRLTGNDGAHPDKDGLADVVEQDSFAIIEFTREYLHHVYVMPAKLRARKTPPVTAPPKTGP
jgi:hypothetical protein